MKLKLVVAALVFTVPLLANADRGGDAWIAPAIVGGAIAGAALYEATQYAPPPPPPPSYYGGRPLTQYEIREEQLRQREFELERREHEYYEHQQHRHHDRDDYDREKCREYYRDDGNSNYYSRNCWNR